MHLKSLTSTASCFVIEYSSYAKRCANWGALRAQMLVENCSNQFITKTSLSVFECGVVKSSTSHMTLF